MAMNLILKTSCSKCGSTSNLYGSNCKHMTLCFSCGKTMALNKDKCFDCDATLTLLIREYSIRASSINDKGYFIGKFAIGLPDFSNKKTAENKWSLQKDGLQNPPVTDALREKYKNKPWLLKDETGQSQYQGHLEDTQSATYYLRMKKKKELIAIPVGSWYNFNKVAKHKQLTLEEAEEKMRNKRKNADGFQRWMMKAANNGPIAFGERGRSDNIESNVGEKNSEDDEGHVSQMGKEDEKEDKEGVDDEEEEDAWGGDHDQADDIKKGDDWDHEKIFSDDDEVFGVDPEVPTPFEIKQEGRLSTSGKELQELLGRASALNETDAEDDDDDYMDDGDGVPPIISSKKKDDPNKEPDENSPLKPAATGPVQGNSSTSMSSNGTTLGRPRGLPRSIIEILYYPFPNDQEPKASVKDEKESAIKSDASPEGALPAPSSSSKVGSCSTMASGSVSEEEIRAVLMQQTPVTTRELVTIFKERLRSSEDKNAFCGEPQENLQVKEDCWWTRISNLER